MNFDSSISPFFPCSQSSPLHLLHPSQGWQRFRNEGSPLKIHKKYCIFDKRKSHSARISHINFWFTTISSQCICTAIPTKLWRIFFYYFKFGRSAPVVCTIVMAGWCYSAQCLCGNWEWKPDEVNERRKSIRRTRTRAPANWKSQNHVLIVQIIKDRISDQ